MDCFAVVAGFPLRAPPAGFQKQLRGASGGLASRARGNPEVKWNSKHTRKGERLNQPVQSCYKMSISGAR